MRTGTDDQPLTWKEAGELLQESVRLWRLIPGHDERSTPNFTCSTCVMLAWCEFAYDHYNTDGDCLANK